MGAIQFSGKTELLNNIIRKLIDTPELQRLRYIRQNGLTNIVFHSMEHSRFAHSLGVAHVARRMYQRVLLNSDLTDKVEPQLRVSTVIAALLHDIGHGPFSHTFEEIIHDIGHTNFSHEKNDN
ncbi:HD domain-containing protein (plasmid) [Acaryochloris sp. 'Moss Beach']|uniref:HD domain-containing protein n=1 Tax=Acaryochloris sp. 'Moss Beach' TaxID=2740837 RepID=UPI001F2F894A|nr:HD domain-containing protein [Acaryochloris sp. 'Moss Beach']UJB73244.1 HD domain-containing protein [Acaryochloris sp. 'Moss Beach']